MNRLQTRHAGLCGAPLLVLVAVSTALGVEPKPNFIFLLASDLGWGDVAKYGHRKIETPNVNRLALNGTLYTQFYVASPAGSPSRAAFMTGRYPDALRIYRDIG